MLATGEMQAQLPLLKQLHCLFGILSPEFSYACNSCFSLAIPRRFINSMLRCGICCVSG